MRLAVTGRSGQVATALLERGTQAGHEVISVGRPELDLTDPASILPAMQTARPDVIVSAAAYTAVDKAESDSALAYAINASGAEAVARAATQLGVPIVHLSTDYVFDGALRRPYVETDPTSPAGVYGASKLAGEQAVLSACRNAAILRVAWVFSPFGNNFVKTMLRLAADRDTISVVDDQFGTPSSALDIADGILTVAANLVSREEEALRGLFHMTAGGETNWADFARAIFDTSKRHGGPVAQVVPIPGSDYPTPATRPANSRLDCALIREVHGVALPDWHLGLATVMARLQTADG